MPVPRRLTASFIAWVMAGILVVEPVSAANCPDRVKETAEAGSPLKLMLLDGTHIEGTFVRVSANSDSLGLLTFDPASSSSQLQNVPFDTISRVTGRSERFSMTYPILGGVLLGTLGLVVGLGYTTDPDSGLDDALAWQAPLVGAAVGFGLGALLSMILPKTITWDADCRD